TPDGTITVTISGGTLDFEYEASFNGAAFTGTTTLVGAGLTSFTYTVDAATGAGTYRFQITDTEGCTALTNIVTVNPLVDPQATHNVTDVTCNEYDNGIVEIDIDTSFGIPPYEISFDGSAFSSQTVYSDLAPGLYNYTVRDSKECTFDDTAEVIEPVEFL